MVYKDWTNEFDSAISYRCEVSRRGVQDPRRASANELSGARQLDNSVRPRDQSRSRTEYRCESLSADQGPAFSPTRDVIIILCRPTQLGDRQDAGRTLPATVIICVRTIESGRTTTNCRVRKSAVVFNFENVFNIRSLSFIIVLF